MSGQSDSKANGARAATLSDDYIRELMDSTDDVDLQGVLLLLLKRREEVSSSGILFPAPKGTATAEEKALSGAVDELD